VGQYTLAKGKSLIPFKAAEAKEIYAIAALLQQRISTVMRYVQHNPG
jgi:hypothetical protein